jgi:hypothetical protein
VQATEERTIVILEQRHREYCQAKVTAMPLRNEYLQLEGEHP